MNATSSNPRLDFLRVHVVWAEGSVEGERIASVLSDHFDGLGMERDGVAIRVPVRFVSAPWDDGSPLPRPIDLTRAHHNAVIMLADSYLLDHRSEWETYIAELRVAMDARGAADLYIPFGSTDHSFTLRCDHDRHTQYARRNRWAATLSGTALDARLLLHVVHTLREHLRGLDGRADIPEKLFVSHAKADGDKTAWKIVEYVNRKDQDVPLKTFYDAKELQPGDDFEREFEAEIRRGTLLAIVSDIYDSRPWCVYELTTAKRAHRPIILVDVGKVRTSRTFPYGANLPKIRVNPDCEGDAWIEQLLVQAVSEGLRCDIFNAQAQTHAEAAGLSDFTILPRPPELFDMLPLKVGGQTLIYPDPPIGALEDEIIKQAVAAFRSPVQLKTLSELEAS